MALEVDELRIVFINVLFCGVCDMVLLQIGFFSGRKRESIFKSPDDPQGKVGVTGSGKGLTDFQKREKHFHLKDGTIENDD